MNYNSIYDTMGMEVLGVKRIDKIMALVAMFLLIIAILLTSFQVAIYGDSEYKFYEKEYAKYNVTASLHMEMEDVMKVTDHMMDYLIGKEEELSIVTMVEGKEQDFFIEQDRLHMWDVQNLFLGGLKLRNLLMIAVIVLLVFLGVRKAELKQVLPRAYTQAFLVFLGILAFLGIAFTVDFTKCFTMFH